MTESITVYLLSPGDRPHYQAQWVEPGSTRRRTKSLKTADPDVAERLRTELEIKLRMGLERPAAHLSWDDFVGRYEIDQFHNFKPNSRKSIRSVLRAFGDHQRPKNLAAVSSQQIAAYARELRSRELRPATISKHLSFLRAALRWANRQELLDRVPRFESVKIPPKEHFATVSLEGMQAIIAAAPNDDWRRFLWTAWHTGMRGGELLALHWEAGPGKTRVDLDAKKIIIPASACKAGKASWVPIHPELAKILEPIRKAEGALFGIGGRVDEVGRKFQKFAAKAGHPIKLHDIRRSFGTRYAPLVPAQILQRLMRHANITTTLKFYADLDPALDDAILRG